MTPLLCIFYIEYYIKHFFLYFFEICLSCNHFARIELIIYFFITKRMSTYNEFVSDTMRSVHSFNRSFSLYFVQCQTYFLKKKKNAKQSQRNNNKKPRPTKQILILKTIKIKDFLTIFCLQLLFVCCSLVYW